ncbi:MAG: RHS repeat-associated core domain-containing protein [Gammaproteobacteria bacterium]|jgi:RHS repeat-associated protein|nr:RHS repeat-associated core domain-containing protein [Gammaproteobacteria bacterium]
MNPKILTTAVLLVAALLFRPAAATMTYYHNDALGSPVLATDDQGAVLWRARYRPFGERAQSAADYLASRANPVWFTGHVHDDVSGLTYMQARYFSPFSGRFLSPDPALLRADDPQTFNRYAYARNNPYRYIDPDGRESIAITVKGSAAFGGGGSLSTGVYLTFPGAADVPFDFGLLSSAAAVAGAEASLTLNLVMLDGGRENLEGRFVAMSATAPLTGVVGPALDAEVFINPETGQGAGTGLGVGLAAFPSASVSLGQSSVDFSVRDAVNSFFPADTLVAPMTEQDMLDALWFAFIAG